MKSLQPDPFNKEAAKDRKDIKRIRDNYKAHKEARETYLVLTTLGWSKW